MRKFCFFTSFHRNNDEVLIFYRQGKTLIENGFDVSYIVSDNIKNEIIENINVKSTGFKPSGYIKRILLAPFYMLPKLLKENADIYQTSSVDFIFICLILKLLNKKVIFNLREEHPYTIKTNPKIPGFIKNHSIWVLEKLMNFTFKHLDIVFTVTDDILYYLKNKWKLNNTYVLTNFPPINRNYELTYEDYSSRENIILYFGTVYEISRQEVFFKALESVEKTHDVKYCIAGKFPSEKYYNYIKTQPYWTKVKFINGFNKNDLQLFFQESIICNVLKDFSETSCPNGSLGVIKIFESMEAGLPIICSDVPIYRMIIEEYNCGILVNPNDEKQIANAIRFLIDNKKEAYNMGKNGRKAVIEKYSWEIQSELYLNQINKL